MESPAIAAMWFAYLQRIGEDPFTTALRYSAWHFCDNARDADELAALVVAGRKRATASVAMLYDLEDEPLPAAGDHSVILDWSGEPRCVIRATAVEVMPFDAVDAEFAAIEGEGDGSLAYWRRVHREAFNRDLALHGLQLDGATPVVCERFEVVHAPPAHPT